MWILHIERTGTDAALWPALSACRELCIEPSRVDVRDGRLLVHVGGRDEADELAGRLARAGFLSHVHDGGPPDKTLLACLSRRERELLDHFVRGLQLKEAAYRMGITLHSAREYWSRIRAKWNVKTHAEAAARLVSLTRDSGAPACPECAEQGVRGGRPPAPSGATRGDGATDPG